MTGRLWCNTIQIAKLVMPVLDNLLYSVEIMYDDKSGNYTINTSKMVLLDESYME